jgi:hypothetical protein
MCKIFGNIKHNQEALSVQPPLICRKSGVEEKSKEEEKEES